MNSIKINSAEAQTLGVNLPNLQNLDTFCQRVIDEKLHPYIAFRVWRKDALIFGGDYGTHSPGGGPLRPDAIFPLQSVTKAFVATCAAILQEQGKLNFFERVQDRFPEFAGENKDNVLIWHLLSHVSGMDDDDIEKKLNEKYEFVKALAEKFEIPEETKEKMLDEIWSVENTLKMPLTALPGTKYSYWGMGYHLIKLLVERISGGTLEEFAKKYIFDPLGMNDTYWFLPEEKRERFPTCDPAFKGGEWMNSVGMMTDDGAGGGLKASLDDLIKFGRMYLNMGTLDGVRIISPATVKLLTRDANKGVPESFWLGRWLSASWGLGWDVKGDKIDDLGMLHSASSYNHGGYGGARLLIDPEYDLVTAIYMREQREISFYDNMNYAADILYSALN
ncbi:MAG: beta-lactamase family protein [Oscillospiraceae bacterium]|jgi:CubicO group peptidase (beta-lactamase class C family)|nr:beta-lactamase family protein [Oscillospiraceae bacterium]